MNTKVSEIIEELTLRFGERKVVEDYVRRALNRVIYSVVSSVAPIELVRREQITVQQTYELPSNTAGILDYESDDESIELSCSSYYDPLVTGTDFSIEKGATAFSATGITDDMAGKHVSMGSVTGLWPLAGANELAVPYRGPRLQSVPFAVRPYISEISAYNCRTGEKTEATAKVRYWVYPVPIYEDWEQLPFDDAGYITRLLEERISAALGRRKSGAEMAREETRLAEAKEEFYSRCCYPVLKTRHYRYR